MALYGLVMIIPARGHYPTVRLYEKPFEKLAEAKKMRRALKKVMPEGVVVRVVEFQLPSLGSDGMDGGPITLLRTISFDEVLP